MSKKTILSGITTSGQLTLGNYIGAINSWRQMQTLYNCFYMIADLHALTEFRPPRELQECRISFLAQYLACGLDPQKNVVFMQSQIPQHTQLCWILQCLTPTGQLNRMTQFKEKSQKQMKNINAGLFTYPTLMAADILLYGADLVPVGEDQIQHLELTRDIVTFFHNRFGDGILTMPQAFTPQQGARIMSLQEPTKKMSKSDPNPNTRIEILDPPKKIQKKIKSAVTDSQSEIKFESSRPGLANLLTIYSVLSKKSIKQLERDYQGKMYGHLKIDLADHLVEFLRPIQQEYQRLRNSEDYLQQIMAEGAHRAGQKAQETLEQVYKRVGLGSLRP